MTYRNRNFIATPVWVLIAVNVLIYIATVFAPDAINLLGCQRAGLADQPWTILTAIFVHGGLWHILANMLMLYFYGTYVVQLVGEIKFLVVYLIGGIAGNALFMLLSDKKSLFGWHGHTPVETDLNTRSHGEQYAKPGW